MVEASLLLKVKNSSFLYLKICSLMLHRNDKDDWLELRYSESM